MTIEWPNALVSTVARRRAVLLIGSGISANSQAANGERPPTWGGFLTNAYKKLNKNIPHIRAALRSYQYLEACEYLEEEFGPQWANTIAESFVDPNYKAADIHRAIFNLDARIVASLNFDKIYDNYANKSSESSVIVKNYYDDDIRQVLIGSGRYIIKPHGSIDTISKMIFTLDEYARARIKHASFYDVFRALLHTHTFVCLGCGLSDPDIKLVFEEYRYQYSEVPHYIVLPKPRSSAECRLIERTRGMQVLLYSPKNDHAELNSSLIELAAKVEPLRAELSQNQNW